MLVENSSEYRIGGLRPSSWIRDDGAGGEARFLWSFAWDVVGSVTRRFGEAHPTCCVGWGTPMFAPVESCGRSHAIPPYAARRMGTLMLAHGTGLPDRGCSLWRRRTAGPILACDGTLCALVCSGGALGSDCSDGGAPPPGRYGGGGSRMRADVCRHRLGGEAARCRDGRPLYGQAPQVDGHAGDRVNFHG